MKQAKRILRIGIARLPDKSPDTSYLGEFSNTANTQFAIDHRARGGNSRDFQWFNAGTVEEFRPDAEWIKGKTAQERRQFWHDAMTTNAELDYEQMCALNNGRFEFIGVRACADITIGDTRQPIYSGGLWGIESDSEASYLKEVESEELASLRETLYELGFSKRAIATAVKERMDA